MERAAAAQPAGGEALTTADVMRRLKIRDPDTVYSLVRANRLKAVRLGHQYRFTEAAVAAFLAGGDAGEQQETERRHRASRPEWLRGVRPTIRR